MLDDPVFLALIACICIMSSVTIGFYYDRSRRGAPCSPLPPIVTVPPTTRPPVTTTAPPTTTRPPAATTPPPGVHGALSKLSAQIGSRVHADVCDTIRGMNEQDFVQKFKDMISEREKLGFIGVYGCESVIFNPCADDGLLRRVAECTGKEKGWNSQDTVDYYFEVLKLIRDFGCNASKTNLDDSNMAKMFKDAKAYFCQRDSDNFFGRV